jgi:hypothetical protein
MSKLECFADRPVTREAVADDHQYVMISKYNYAGAVLPRGATRYPADWENGQLAPGRRPVLPSCLRNL